MPDVAADSIADTKDQSTLTPSPPTGLPFTSYSTSTHINMSLLQPPRILSNKENSLLSPSYMPRSFLPSATAAAATASSSKPGLSGLGRSPRKRAAGHSPKPYARSASVHKPTTGKALKKKQAPPPLKLAAAAKVTKPVKPEIVSVRSQVDIPLTLPRVDIPLVPHLDDVFDPEIVSSALPLSSIPSNVP